MVLASSVHVLAVMRAYLLPVACHCSCICCCSHVHVHACSCDGSSSSLSPWSCHWYRVFHCGMAMVMVDVHVDILSVNLGRDRSGAH